MRRRGHGRLFPARAIDEPEVFNPERARPAWPGGDDELQGGDGRDKVRGGRDDDKVYGGLNAFFLLMDKPEAYKLPNAENAVLPGRNNVPGYLGGLLTAILGVLAAIIARRQRNMEPLGEGR